MGYGDEIMATGLARGLHARGKLAAFGDGRRIMHGPWCEEMFRHNPNVAKPGQEYLNNLEWISHYKGSRLYNSFKGGRWKWNYKFKVIPGQFYFDDKEKKLAGAFLGDYIVVEPNVPWQKRVASNKDWSEEKYEHVAIALQRCGYRIVQFTHKNSRRKLTCAHHLEFKSFRDAIAVLSKANLFVGPEGGMHHAAAAVGVRAVVIMGGFIPPEVVGYDNHVNLTGGAKACGNVEPCLHCHAALRKISVDEVLAATSSILEGEKSVA